MRFSRITAIAVLSLSAVSSADPNVATDQHSIELQHGNQQNVTKFVEDTCINDLAAKQKFFCEQIKKFYAIFFEAVQGDIYQFGVKDTQANVTRGEGPTKQEGSRDEIIGHFEKFAADEAKEVQKYELLVRRLTEWGIGILSDLAHYSREAEMPKEEKQIE